MSGQLRFAFSILLLAGCGGVAGRNDGATPDAAACNDARSLGKGNGEACDCPAECASTFCVEGVCCNEACKDACRSCASSAAIGVCSASPAGSAPRRSDACIKESPLSCGQDGTCDGRGGCGRYPAGTVCREGHCLGDVVTGISVCDGQGVCLAGPDEICAPYACDPAQNQCYTSCSTTPECAGTHQCADSRCGLKSNGAICSQASECASGFCADGVCCASACQGACFSCNQVGKVGRCLPVPDDALDPHRLCGSGTVLCGDTGRCRGGLCAKSSAGSPCAPSYCAGTLLVQSSACDGNQACRAGMLFDCAPFRCVSTDTGAGCIEFCTDDSDCVPPFLCVAGSCGKKRNGGSCVSDGQCESGICADGVCCNERCSGACRSCAVTGSAGVCTPVGAGVTDPHGVCVDQTATTCGNNGRCDGALGCQKHAAGTVCAPDSCANAIHQPASVCDGSGNCLKPRTIPCYPFQCNGSRCYERCASNGQCVSPNLCNGDSCGLKANGLGCSSDAECSSGVCAQGVCCDRRCDSACHSCALASSLGSCRAVADGAPDPAGRCAVADPSSCGTSGLCAGGTCAKYRAGTQCQAPSCSGATLTSPRVCDGVGVCGPAAESSCVPFRCDRGACRMTCMSDGDCVPPAVCLGNSCGLKPNGMACGTSIECQSSRCVDGVCCESWCSGACRACAITGHLGTCWMMAASERDPSGACPEAPVSTCGTDGACDGRGGCHLYGPGTPCSPGGCSGATLTNFSTCDGLGVCQAGSTESCAPYVCADQQRCGDGCASNGDCVPGKVCLGNACVGALGPGQVCTRSDQCQVGTFCTDGVCCSSVTCGVCQSCRGANPGTCTNLTAGAVDERCIIDPSRPCGLTGACDGSGACAKAPATSSCGSASCSDGVLTTSHCSGDGICKSATAGCGAYRCDPMGTYCLTECGSDGDCASGKVCVERACELQPTDASVQSDAEM